MTDVQAGVNVFVLPASSAGQFRLKYAVEYHVTHVWEEPDRESYTDEPLVHVEGIVVWCSYAPFRMLGSRYSALKEECFPTLADLCGSLSRDDRHQAVRTTFRYYVGA